MFAGEIETTREAFESRLKRYVKDRLVALARRLLVIAYHLLRDETVYDATRLKRRAA